jgi:hypothetical protein
VQQPLLVTVVRPPPVPRISSVTGARQTARPAIKPSALTACLLT